nr:hypothetical protein [Haloferax gibbonsii]
MGASSLVVPLYAIELGANALFVGLIAATAAFAGAPGAVLWGRLAARAKRRRPFILVALVATAGALSLTATVSSPAAVLVANALLWFVVAAAVRPRVGQYPPAERPRRAFGPRGPVRSLAALLGAPEPRPRRPPGADEPRTPPVPRGRDAVFRRLLGLLRAAARVPRRLRPVRRRGVRPVRPVESRVGGELREGRRVRGATRPPSPPGRRAGDPRTRLPGGGGRRHAVRGARRARHPRRDVPRHRRHVGGHRGDGDGDGDATRARPDSRGGPRRVHGAFEPRRRSRLGARRVRRRRRRLRRRVRPRGRRRGLCARRGVTHRRAGRRGGRAVARRLGSRKRKRGRSRDVPTRWRAPAKSRRRGRRRA